MKTARGVPSNMVIGESCDSLQVVPVSPVCHSSVLYHIIRTVSFNLKRCISIPPMPYWKKEYIKYFETAYMGDES